MSTTEPRTGKRHEASSPGWRGRLGVRLPVPKLGREPDVVELGINQNLLDVRPGILLPSICERDATGAMG